jgi:hypothetical protein
MTSFARPLTPAREAYERAHWHEDRSPQLVAVITTMLVLATAAVITRLLSNRLAERKFFLDDFAIALSLVR